MHVSVVGFLLVVAAPLIKKAIVVHLNAQNSRFHNKLFTRALVHVLLYFCLLGERGCFFESYGYSDKSSLSLELCLLIGFWAEVRFLSAGINYEKKQRTNKELCKKSNRPEKQFSFALFLCVCFSEQKADLYDLDTET